MAYERDLLDPTNRRIIGELQTDARITIAELGRRVSLSPPAVGERVQRLEEAGVITGYHTAIDPRSVGFALSAIIRVRPGVRELQRIPEIARGIPEVVECQRTTGEDCFFLKVYLRSIDELPGILDQLTPYGQTTTAIVASTAFSNRPLPLPNDDAIEAASDHRADPLATRSPAERPADSRPGASMRTPGRRRAGPPRSTGQRQGRR
jgi:Lrp/AsnC family leucine-responsive transcriptional regulator